MISYSVTLQKHMNKAEHKKLRARSIYRVTIIGSMFNAMLLALKFVAGIVGGSAAMIADAVHSASDFVTDIIVLVFVRLSNKPIDHDHDYGHGKYETLATAFIGLALLAVGLMICFNGIVKVWQAIQGVPLETPGWIAFVVAVASVVSKEWLFQYTIRVGRRVGSQSVEANAWHHRTDAFSSIGTSIGIGGAIILGQRWAVLDPLAAIVVSYFILRAAYDLIKKSASELLEASLPDELEEQIVATVKADPLVSDVHNLRTRRIGNSIAMELHFRMPGAMTLYDAHLHATEIERRLHELLGQDSLITLHFEPLKVNGKYVPPQME